MPEIVHLSLPIGNRRDPHLSFNTRSGGVAIDGSEQIISPLSSRWMWTISIPIINKAAARSIRAVKTRLMGRFNYLSMRVCDQYRINRRDIGAVGSIGVPHSDETPHSDDTPYALAQPGAPVTADAAAWTSIVTIRASDFGGAMTAGVWFSINQWLYQVDNWELSGSNYILQISPPLREPIIIGDFADFHATSLWRLQSDDEGLLDLQIGRFGAVTLNLVEPIGRLPV